MQIYFCFKGNYDQYVKTREELEENQMKRFNWEQDQIAHMKVSEMPMVFFSADDASFRIDAITLQHSFQQVFDNAWDLAEQPPGTDVVSNIIFIFLCPSLELHCPVWSRLCKAGTAGTEQRENSAEDGSIRFD